MNRDQARTLIAQTFTQSFDKSRFGGFVVNVLNQIDESKAGAWNSQYIKDAFKDHVQRYERLGTYTSPEKEKLDVLIVYLTTASKLERARTAIRNFVADHLKNRDEKEAALVAFVSPTFCANSVNYIIFKDSRVKPEYLLALLNSTLLNFVFSKTSTNSNVNGYEVDNLPIKMSDDQGQMRLAALATKILSAKRRNAAADTTSLEREIDTHVYDLYGFTQEQRAFVETRSAQRPGGQSEPTIVATVVD